MKRAELRLIICEVILEDRIGQFLQSIDIIYNIDKTSHANDRKYRHDDIITDKSIINTVNQGLSKIAKEMIFDNINIGDSVVIVDKKTNLNVVCSTQKEGARLKFIVITVMIKPNFTPKSGTHVVYV